MCCHTTLWNITARKQAINNKLQGSVATHLRCGGVVNNQIKNGLLISLSVNLFFATGEYFAKVRSKNVVVSCTFLIARLANTLLKD